MVVGIGVKVPVPNDRSDRPHDCRSLRGDELIVVSENHSNLCPLQPTNAMGSCQHVILTDQGGSTVELAIVDDPSSPWVLIHSSGSSSYDPRLLFLPSAFC